MVHWHNKHPATTFQDIHKHGNQHILYCTNRDFKICKMELKEFWLKLQHTKQPKECCCCCWWWWWLKEPTEKYNMYPVWCPHPLIRREEQHPYQLWCQGWYPSASAVLEMVSHHQPSGTGSHGTESRQRCSLPTLCLKKTGAEKQQHIAQFS